MDLTRPWKRALAGACALMLLVVACGDDDDGGDAAEDTEQSTEAEETTESTEAEEETTESTEAEEETTESTEAGGGETEGQTTGAPEAIAIAEAVNLKLEDFAEGWTESEPETGYAEPDPIDECFTENDATSTQVGEAKAPNFEVSAEGDAGGQGQGVSMKTSVYDSPESATAVVDEVGTDAFAACMTEYLTTQLLDGIEAQLVPVADDPPVGEQSAGVAGAISIDAGDGSPPSEGLVDMHAIRTGPVVSFTMTVDTVGDETFQSTLTELYTVIADRQAAEVG